MIDGLALAALLSRDDRKALDAISLSPRPIRAGVDLIGEGAPADHVHLIAEGWVCRYKTTGQGTRQIVGLALPGDVANVDSYLFDRPDFGLRPLTAATIVSVQRERLLALAAERPAVARALTWTALVENATLSVWALSLGRHSAQRRLAHLLCELAVRLGCGDDDDAVFDMPLTQEHLADALGLTSVHVNRTIQQLRADGLIVTANRTVTIPDVARLRELGEFDPAYLHLDGAGSALPTDLDGGTPRRSPPPFGAGL